MEFSPSEFNPAQFPGVVYDNFCEFDSSYAYFYETFAREPPESANTDALRAAWHKENKRCQFLNGFTGRSFQNDFEDSVIESERSTFTFKNMVG